MQHYYQVDKRAAYETLAVEAGIVLRGSLKSKKQKNAFRVRHRKRKRMTVESFGDEDYEDQCEIVDGSEDEESNNVVDEYVGLSLWIDCTGGNGISLRLFKGIIISITQNDEYLVRLI
jgi:hypothetical protein